MNLFRRQQHASRVVSCRGSEVRKVEALFRLARRTFANLSRSFKSKDESIRAIKSFASRNVYVLEKLPLTQCDNATLSQPTASATLNGFRYKTGIKHEL